MFFPKVSVIIPVYNLANYIENTVASLLAQTYQNIEIILVENASSDGSLERCRELALADKRIKVLHSDIGDLSHARNLGIECASSEYVAFVDSDDTVAEDMYQVLLGIAEEHDLDIVYSNVVKVYDNCPPKYTYSEDGTITIMTPKEMLMRNFMHKINTNACSMLVKRSLFQNLRFPEFMYFEDRAFTFRLIAAASRTGYINKSFYNYYQRPGSIIHLRNWKMYYDYADSDRIRLKFINSSDMFSDEEKLKLSEKSADSLIRKIRHLYFMAKSESQKEQLREMIQSMSCIPPECHLPLKARIIRMFIKKYSHK